MIFVYLVKKGKSYQQLLNQFFISLCMHHSMIVETSREEKSSASLSAAGSKS